MGHLSNPALRGSLILIVLLPYAWSSPFLDLGLGDTSQGNNGIDFDASLAGSKSIHLGNERGNDIRPVVAQRPNIIVFDAPLTTPPPIVIVSPPIRPLPPPQQQPCVHPGPPPQYHHQPGHGPPPQQYHQQSGQGPPRHYRGLEVNSTNNVTAKNQSHPIQNIFQVKEARSVVLENPGAEAVHPVHLNSTYVNNTKAANETKSDRPVSPRLLGMANVYHRVFGGARK